MALEAVLLASARPIDAAAAGAVLGPLLGLAMPDAVRRARYAGGVLVEEASPEVAEALVRGLAAQGIGARRVAAERLPAPPRPRRAVRARVTEAALALALGPLGPEAVFAWDEVALVLPFALAVRPRPEPEDGAPRPPARAAAAAIAGARERADVLGELSPACTRLAEALAREPARVGLDVFAGAVCCRVWRDEFQFGPESGLPDDAPPHSLERFLSFARLLLARALRAPETPECAALVEHGLLEPALFADEGELARYERWWLAREL
jgi:hypothetical protein